MHSFLDRPFLNGQEADEWRRSNPEEVSSNLQKWYKAGRLLFPRESLQSIHDQITKSPKKGEFIYVQGFDDVVYEYRVLTGNRRWSYAPDYSKQDEEGWLDPENCERVQYTFCKPHPCYNSIESLLRHLDWSMPHAYTSLSIGHWMSRVDKPEPQGDYSASLDLFRTSYAAWEDSAAWGEIRTTLRSLRLPCRITKVIGIANGTFAVTPSYPEGFARSAVQHAFLLTVKKALQADGMASDDVACYVQDPAYNTADRAVLREYGIQVVEDPEGFLLMDAASVVFSCAPNICVKQIVADIVRPAVIIWCRVAEDDPEHPSTDPNSPRVREMMEKEYEEFPFPEDENFTAMRIYPMKGGIR